MAPKQQEQSPRCSNNNSRRGGGGGGGGDGGRLIRKVEKPNKVPRRGKGVAQLEKIISEQRQSKDSGVGERFQQPEIPLPPPLLPLRNRNLNPNRYVLTVPQFHQSSSSSRVNVPLGIGTSTSLSSVMNTHIGPPSIQSYYGEDKMVGKKRSYDFLTENIPIPKPDEPISCSNGSISSSKVKIPCCREKSPEFGIITKDFLTLAPPKSSPPSHSELEEKFPPTFRGQTRDSSGKEWSNQQPLLSLFPEAQSHGTNNDEIEEQVDLTLKL